MSRRTKLEEVGDENGKKMNRDENFIEYFFNVVTQTVSPCFYIYIYMLLFNFVAKA